MLALLGEVGVSGGGRRRRVGALRGGGLGLPPGPARLLPLEPDQQALAREANDAAATHDGHLGAQ